MAGEGFWSLQLVMFNQNKQTQINDVIMEKIRFFKFGNKYICPKGAKHTQRSGDDVWPCPYFDFDPFQRSKG